MTEQVEAAIIPSNPADQDKVRKALEEMEASFLRSDSEKALRKAIADRMKEELGVPKKVFNQMAKTFYKDNFDEVEQESEEFSIAYQTIVKK